MSTAFLEGAETLGRQYPDILSRLIDAATGTAEVVCPECETTFSAPHPDLRVAEFLVNKMYQFQTGEATEEDSPIKRMGRELQKSLKEAVKTNATQERQAAQ
jgi:uncharacterized protein YbbK (DUF523 family)